MNVALGGGLSSANLSPADSCHGQGQHNLLLLHQQQGISEQYQLRLVAITSTTVGNLRSTNHTNTRITGYIVHINHNIQLHEHQPHLLERLGALEEASSRLD